VTIALPAPGAVGLLTTYGAAATLHARPVVIWAGSGPYEVVVLTAPDAAKVSEILSQPQVSLGGSSDDGWWAAEGIASVDRDAAADTLRSAGLPDHLPVVAVRIALTRLRRWTVTGSGPWDNTYDEWVLGDD